MADATDTLRLNMGYSAAEFECTLNRAFPATDSGYELEHQAPGHWRISVAEIPLRIDLHIRPEPDRQLGSLTLPVLDVTLRFDPRDTPAKERFMNHFWRHFHKGGG